MHLVDMDVGFMGAVPIVGSTIPIAVGLAFATHLQRSERVVVAFFGEGATEEGVFHESANFASLHQLPIVFACENNLYSVYSPMGVRQPSHRQVCEQARGHGIEARQVDGNDIRRVYEAAHAAVAHARSGEGPVFLEFLTYRWREHCGPNYDNHIGYRTEAEFLEWKERDPLVKAEKDLQTMEIHSGGVELMKRKVQEEIQQAFAAVERAPFPAPETLTDYVLAV